MDNGRVGNGDGSTSMGIEGAAFYVYGRPEDCSGGEGRADLLLTAGSPPYLGGGPVDVVAKEELNVS